MNKTLIEKHQVPAPRYTSYPTVPYWDEQAPTSKNWLRQVSGIIEDRKPIGVYIHLPFCENLCTYCGCHKRITKNHQLETPYIKALLQEWNIYKKQAFHRSAEIQELHLGGGTPTFFAPAQLEFLISRLLKNQTTFDNTAMSFEAHPSSTSTEHLKTLNQLGFKRISIGVQEFSPLILETINRNQTKEQVIHVTEMARSLGYESINYDLLYGLPHQTEKDIQTMMDHVDQLRPERIAYYGYAHIPWIKPSQRAYSVEDLPKGLARWNLFEKGRERLLEMGYEEIGMDHFALPSDDLAEANRNGRLHRNFMGYTPLFTDLLIGLGASSISDSWSKYVQNEKKIETYQQQVANGILPIIRGHQLTPTDELLRQHILNIMCSYETTWNIQDIQTPLFKTVSQRIQPFIEDGLINIKSNQKWSVTQKGRPFIRNISMAFDTRYWDNKQAKQQFSKAM